MSLVFTENEITIHVLGRGAVFRMHQSKESDDATLKRKADRDV
jgi:hypothetical protein